MPVPVRAGTFRSAVMSEREFRRGLAAEIRTLAAREDVIAGADSPLLRRARAIVKCALWVLAPECGKCGSVDTRRAAIFSTCSLRTCPTCARYRANEICERVDEVIRKMPRHARMDFYLLTFTLRYDADDPETMTPRGLRKRAEIVKAAAAYAWRKCLKAPGHALLLGIECAKRGMVHAHALYYGRRPDIEQVRTAYMLKAGDSPFVNVEPITDPHSAVREVVKYIAKLASPKRLAGDNTRPAEYIDPRLAAAIEVGFAGMRLVEVYGAWRGKKIGDDTNAAEDPVAESVAEQCPDCGAPGPHPRVPIEREAFIAIAPNDWRPQLTRRGLDPPPQ